MAQQRDQDREHRTQENFDLSQPDDYGFARGNAFGQNQENKDRNGNNHRQQSSYPSDTYSGRNTGDDGADHTYGESFGERRNAAYDQPRYRSSSSARDRDQRQDYSNAGQPAYTGFQQSRSSQPGYDHVHEYRNRQGQYEARQGGYPNRFGETSFGQERSEGANQRGKGPRNYQRLDHRIMEDVNDRLTDDHDVDASDIEVTVSGGEVVLSGVVSSRQAKRLAEEITESVSGVRQVENRLRVSGAQE